MVFKNTNRRNFHLPSPLPKFNHRNRWRHSPYLGNTDRYNWQDFHIWNDTGKHKQRDSLPVILGQIPLSFSQFIWTVSTKFVNGFVCRWVEVVVKVSFKRFYSVINIKIVIQTKEKPEQANNLWPEKIYAWLHVDGLYNLRGKIFFSTFRGQKNSENKGNLTRWCKGRSQTIADQLFSTGRFFKTEHHNINMETEWANGGYHAQRRVPPPHSVILIRRLLQ